MQAEWADEVRAALLGEDREALAGLFAAAEEAEGDVVASRSWLEVVSAFDANAVTG